MTPVSLLAAMTDTTDTAVPSSSSTAASSSRSTRPQSSTPTTRPPSATVGSSTAWCSTAEHTGTPGRGGSPPLMACVSASVPPEVNTTSDGRRPIAAATRSRASSTARTASRAKRCEPEGLP